MTQIGDEFSQLASSNVSTIKIALLLRLGEVELAEKCWAVRRFPSEFLPSEPNAVDPFQLLAFEWAWSLFDRTICAHMRGDDRIALLGCRLLNEVRLKLEPESKRLHQGEMDARALSGMRSVFSFLDPVPDLLRDQIRRNEQGAHQTMFQIGPEKFPDKAGRIAQLISDLEEAAEPQWGQPGSVDLGLNKLVVALTEQGEEAVEPLLKCMADDARLTRSVGFHRSFMAQRHVMSVKDAAQAALRRILKVRFDTVDAYRGYWEKYKTMPLVERWFAILKDDEAGTERWMEASANILSRTDGSRFFDWMWPRRTGTTNKLIYVADSLRAKVSPSVSELLLKRALEIASKRHGNSEDCWKLSNAARLGLMLHEWQGKESAAGLWQIMQLFPAELSRGPARNSYCENGWSFFGTLAVTLAREGKNDGLELYANTMDPKYFRNQEDVPSPIFAPMGFYPAHPMIKAVSERFFSEAGDDWIKPRFGKDLLKTQLVRNEAFQAQILKALLDRSRHGTITIKTNGTFGVLKPEVSEGGSLSPGVELPKTEKVVDFRLCDDVVHRLSRIEGIPQLELYWPESRRDEAVSAAVKFLQENRNAISLKPPDLFTVEE